MKKENIVGIIPARGGSVGVPLKNIRKLGGNPLIHYDKICFGIKSIRSCNSFYRS